jgi:hypothetical protein
MQLSSVFNDDFLLALTFRNRNSYSGMDFDISHILEQWDYSPGQVVVRKFTAKDGTEKLQLRVDLGLLQMNMDGRPDGKRPLGHPSLFDFYKTKLYKHIAANNGDDEGFELAIEDCAKLQLESLQFHHRYICLLQLDDYDRVIRDTQRNLEVFEFVEQYAESEDLAWTLLQFQPQLLMIRTRALAAQELKAEDYEKAVEQVDAGLESIREFFRKTLRVDLMEHSGEIQSLERWREDLISKRPLSEREKLEIALQDAIRREDYKRAAECRDALKNLKE